MLPFAKELLEKYGEFYPFGSSIALNGDRNLNATYTGEEHPKVSDVIDMLEEGFRVGHALAVTAVCSNVILKPEDSILGSGAIRVSMESVLGDSIDVLMPYIKNDGGYAYEPLTVQSKEPRIFTPVS